MDNFRTYSLAVQFYHASKELKLSSNLRSQLVRAASSIVLNLAEGRGRMSRPDQLRFFRIAFGSLRECQAILDLGNFRGNPVVTLADSLAAHLYRLMQSYSRGG